MTQRIKEIMERTNYWLSFAEAKCAGIGVINLTIIIAVIGVLFDKYSELPCYLLIYMYNFLICNIISLILILIAMLPCLDKLKEQNTNRNEEDKNLIFYGDIATYNCGITYGLNQIGIKIDMYRQEHRFSPATPVFRRFDVWYAAYIPVPFPAFPRLLEYPQSRHRNSRCRFSVSVSRLFSHTHGLRFYPQMRLGFRALARRCGCISL